MTLRARDLMTANPLTVPTDATLLDVQHLLVVAHIGGAPVAEPSGVVVGMVSASDVLCAVEQALDEDSDPGEPEDVIERLQSITVREIATLEVVWVSPDTAATRVAHMMRTEGIHRVLVGTREQLEGILTSFDLLRAL
jgi:CBS domain-containing protein